MRWFFYCRTAYTCGWDFLPAGCHVSRFTCPAWSLWDSFHPSNLMLHMDFCLLVAIYSTKHYSCLPGCHGSRFTYPAGSLWDSFHLSNLILLWDFYQQVAMFWGLPVQREGTDFTFTTWCCIWDFYQRFAIVWSPQSCLPGCYAGSRVYLSKEKFMGQLLSC